MDFNWRFQSNYYYTSTDRSSTHTQSTQLNKKNYKKSEGAALFANNSLNHQRRRFYSAQCHEVQPASGCGKVSDEKRVWAYWSLAQSAKKKEDKRLTWHSQSPCHHLDSALYIYRWKHSSIIQSNSNGQPTRLQLCVFSCAFGCPNQSTQIADAGSLPIVQLRRQTRPVMTRDTNKKLKLKGI